MPTPYLNIAILGMKTIFRVLLLHLQVNRPLSLTAEPPRCLSVLLIGIIYTKRKCFCIGVFNHALLFATLYC